MTTNTRNLSTLLFLVALWMTTGCATAKVDSPRLINWEVETSHPYVLAGEVTEAVVNVDVSAALPDKEGLAIPLNISLVIDHSGSMSGDQMEDARKALLYMLSQLDGDDHVSVVAFSTQVDVLVPQTEWDDVDKEELAAAIRDLKPRGTTAMQDALQRAYTETLVHYDASHINRIILLSDGIPNDGAQLMSIANNARSYGIGITTMGLGPYYNEDLMAQIADTSGGNYRFIRNSGELKQFFLAEKQSMEQIVGRSLQLTFNLGPGVEIVQTLGGTADLNGRRVSVFLGELGPSDKRQIAFKLRVKAPASGAKVEIADAHLTWEDVINWSGNQERWAYVEAESTQNQATVDEHRDNGIMEKVGRLHAAWEMDNAIREYEAGRRDQAKKHLKRAAQQYRDQRVKAEAALEVAPASVSGPGNVLDAFIEEAAEALDSSEPDSDDGKVLIKAVKSRSRSEAR